MTKIKNFIRGFVITYIVLAISFIIGMYGFVFIMSLFDSNFSATVVINGYFFIAMSFITLACWAVCKVVEKLNYGVKKIINRKEAKLSAE